MIKKTVYRNVNDRSKVRGLERFMAHTIAYSERVSVPDDVGHEKNKVPVQPKEHTITHRASFHRQCLSAQLQSRRYANFY